MAPAAVLPAGVSPSVVAALPSLGAMVSAATSSLLNRFLVSSDYSEENAKPQKPMLSQLEGLAA